MGQRDDAELRRDQEAQEAATTAWASARAYARHLAANRPLARVDVHGLVLEQGEYASFHTTATYQRWYGMDVPYQQNSVFAFGHPAFVAGALIGTAVGNSRARSRAQQMAAEQWRDIHDAFVLATPRRFLINTATRGWLSFWFSGVQEFYPEVESWQVSMVWPDVAPLRLSGLAAPYLAVHAAWAIMPDRWFRDPRLNFLLT